MTIPTGSSSAAASATAQTSSVSSAVLRHSRVIDHVPFFYGWVILVAGTAGIVMMGPTQTFTVSLFIDSFVTDLGISRANISLLYGVATLGASALLPLTGRAVDRFGTRMPMVIATLLTALSCVAFSQVIGVWTFLLGMLALRFIGFGSMQLISNNVIAQWFVRRRGLVMGLSGQSLAISLLLFPALSQYLIGRFEWRGAWVVMGIMILVIMLPISYLFFRDRPELYGLQPDGNVKRGSLYPNLVNEVNWTLAEATRTGVFWLFAVGFTIMPIIMAGLVFHQVSLFAERGLSQNTAVYAFQIMAIVSIAGNLGMGYLLDKMSARLLLVIQLMLLVLALVLVQIMSTPAMAMLFATVIGLASGGQRVMDATIWAKYYGRLHLGSIRGVTMIGTVGGTALGAYPLGLSFDLTGSYGPALTALMVLPVLLALSTLFVRRPAKNSAPGNSA